MSHNRATHLLKSFIGLSRDVFAKVASEFGISFERTVIFPKNRPNYHPGDLNPLIFLGNLLSRKRHVMDLRRELDHRVTEPTHCRYPDSTFNKIPVPDDQHPLICFGRDEESFIIRNRTNDQENGD